MKKTEDWPEELCVGAVVRPVKEDAEKNKNQTIFLKAVVVCLLTSGSIGFFLSSISITYNPVFVNAAIIAMCFYFSYFYRTKRKENIGALLFFIVFSIFIIYFRNYVNSGFYAVVNRTVSRISDFFNTTGMKTYTEKIADRNLTVTAFAIVWAAALEFFLMSAVIVRAGYIITVLLTVTLNLLPVYLKLTPQPFYPAALLSGLFMTYMIRASGHYRLSRSATGYDRTKSGFTYVNNSQILFHTIIFAGGLILAFSFPALFGEKSYDDRTMTSSVKKAGEDTVKNAMLLGFDGLFNRYPSTGGLNSGKLGGVSQLRNDNQPDLDVTFAPYTQSRVYLRGFVFDKYNPVKNYWSLSDITDQEDVSLETSDLSSKYNKSSSDADANGVAKGVMQIENVGAPKGTYLPYYSDEASSAGDNTEKVTYYPLTDKGNLSAGGKSVDEKYLSVPDEDKAAVEKFCKANGLTKGMDESQAVSIISAYFQKNYPYTLRPGATPANEDFVSYFLNTNKKGYCAHFASSAVLILRYLGIPARYCEGYVIDFERISDTAEAEDDQNYSDYYDGYNELGQSGVIKVSVPDTNAHAWVEVYDEKEGWIVADVTPASTESDGDSSGILSSFLDLLSGGSGSSNDSSQQANDTTDDSESTGSEVFSAGPAGLRIFFLVIILLFLSPFVITLIRKILDEKDYRNEFAAADNSGKLILWFEHETRWLRRHDP
ncbi:MAG: transglutaminase domain-containing protein, partial [Candidatus Weimeria sp.]